MNDPTDRELLDLLGVKVENKNNPNNSLFEKLLLDLKRLIISLRKIIDYQKINSIEISLKEFIQ